MDFSSLLQLIHQLFFFSFLSSDYSSPASGSFLRYFQRISSTITIHRPLRSHLKSSFPKLIARFLFERRLRFQGHESLVVPNTRERRRGIHADIGLEGWRWQSSRKRNLIRPSVGGGPPSYRRSGKNKSSQSGAGLKNRHM